VKRTAATVVLCWLLPVGCSHFAFDTGISEKELRTFFTKNRSQLDNVLWLHQIDPTLKLAKAKGAWESCEGRPGTLLAAQKAVDSLPGVIHFDSSRDPFEISLVLSQSSGNGFFELLNRGIVFCEAMPESNQELVQTKSFDNIAEYNVRYLRTLSGGWRMFHHRTTD
jgi:hypothetical protein